MRGHNDPKSGQGIGEIVQILPKKSCTQNWSLGCTRTVSGLSKAVGGGYCEQAFQLDVNFEFVSVIEGGLDAGIRWAAVVRQAPFLWHMR